MSIEHVFYLIFACFDEQSADPLPLVVRVHRERIESPVIRLHVLARCGIHVPVREPPKRRDELRDTISAPTSPFKRYPRTVSVHHLNRGGSCSWRSRKSSFAPCSCWRSLVALFYSVRWDEITSRHAAMPDDVLTRRENLSPVGTSTPYPRRGRPRPARRAAVPRGSSRVRRCCT